MRNSKHLSKVRLLLLFYSALVGTDYGSVKNIGPVRAQEILVKHHNNLNLGTVVAEVMKTGKHQYQEVESQMLRSLAMVTGGGVYVGTPCVAVAAGEVVSVMDDNSVSGISVSTLFLWNSVVLKLDNGHYVEYVHIQQHSVTVKDIYAHFFVLCCSFFLLSGSFVLVRVQRTYTHVTMHVRLLQWARM